MDRLTFYNAGPSQLPGLIVAGISDAVEPDLDPALEQIVVLINANDVAQTFNDPAFVGMDLSLNSIQANSVDPVVRTARFNSTTGAFTVPGRTAAVFTTTPRINGSVTQTASTTPVVHGTYVDVAVSLTNNTDADIMDAFAIVPIDPDTEYVMGSATGGAYPVNARFATQLIRERGLQGTEALSGLDLSGKSPDEVVAVAWAGPLALNETIDFGFTVKVTAMSGEVQHDVTVFDGGTFLGSIASDPLMIVDNSTYAVNRSRRFNVDRDTFIEGNRPGAFNGDAQTMWVGFYNQMRPVVHTRLEGIPTDSAVDTAYLYVYVYEGRGFANWPTSVIPNVQASPVTTVWMPDATNWWTPWTTPGGDYGMAGPSTNLGSGKIGTWLRLDVTAAAEDMLRSGFNQGFMLTSDDVGGVRYGLATKENWTGYVGYMRVYFRTAE